MGNGQAPKQNPSGERTKGPLVLVVEDSEDVRLLFVDILTRQGYTVAEAENGQTAVLKAQARPPAVIVMDISLPVMDGARAARVLRADERTRAIPIIALTGRPLDPQDRRLFDHVLMKPCVPDVLVHRLATILPGARGGAAGDAT